MNTEAVTAINTHILNNGNCEFVLIVGDLVLGESGAAPPTLDAQFQSFKDTMSASGSGMKLVGASGGGLVYYPVRGKPRVGEYGVWD